MQAKDVPEERVLAFIAERDTPASIGVSIWDIADAFPAFPTKVMLAKMRALKKRDIVSGCACGCRGDFKIARRSA